MRNFRFFLLLTAAGMLSSAALAQETHIRGKVPFDFVVGDRVYPAGDYRVNSVGSINEAVRIDNDTENQSAMVLAFACAANQRSQTTKLVFHRVGDRYFLYQIWTAGSSRGREFRKSHLETKLALNRPKPELIIVAANSLP